MANPLDRTWYNTLVDDDGSGTTGTVWNKTAVDGLLDSVDASLATVVDKTGGPASGYVAVFNDADTVRGTAALSHDGQTLLVQAPAANAIAVGVVKPVNAAPTDATVRLVGYSPSLNFLDKDFGTNWQIGLNDDAADSLDIGPGAYPLATPAIRILNTTYEVVLPYGRLRFPTTPNVSTDPRTIDDYYRGPWSPRLAGTSGSSGNSYSAQDGFYTKLGKLIVAEFTVALSVKGTNAGNLAIDNFPAAAAKGSATCLVQFYGLATNWITVRAHIQPGTVYAILYGMNAAGPSNLGVPLTQADLAAGTDLRGVLMYHTA